MAIKFTNNAFATLAASINSSVTTISLAAGTGARFPSLGGTDYFYATLVDSSNNIEIVKVTARSTDTLTVVRGEDSSTARSFAAGDRIELRPVAAVFEDVQAYTPSGSIAASTVKEAIAELDTEKAPLASPTFTGIPAAPTASAGTSTTQLATTAFVQAALEAVYPVGSIYINATSTTNPATLLGFGTWTAFGAGRVIVGQDASDSDFDVLEETGGSKNASVVSHTHTFSATSGSSGSHAHNVVADVYGNSGTSPWGGGTYIAQHGSTGDSYYRLRGTDAASPSVGATSTVSDHNHSVSGTTDSSGSSGTGANLQPYIVVRMWKRTA